MKSFQPCWPPTKRHVVSYHKTLTPRRGFEIKFDHMKKEEIVAKVKALNLPPNSFVVFGSGPLAVAGLREANDIDLLVSEEIFAELKDRGWKELIKGQNDRPLVFDIFEAHDNWDFSPYSPTLQHILATATVIEGVPFASLKEVRKWKVASGGPKHLADVKLIDQKL